ncbi:MAG TPA: complex I NDUFA9 subunit family protein [Gaiellaceae bacterium]|nr:complex I NDUFA9 subunit family protein [Gaiellaceae bacterium]
MRILVTGGTGFIGPRIVHALRAQNDEVRVLVRRPERATRISGLGAETVAGDMTDPASLEAALDGVSHVVHLVAILQGRPADFERIMIQGTRNLIAASKQAGIERLTLMSAIGAGDPANDVVPYYRAKTAQENDLVASGLEYTIFRPGFVFGPGGALPLFITQVKVTPLVPVIGSGLQRSQPMWVDDVAEYFARSLGMPEAANRVFELGGPDTVSWNELYLTIAKVLGKRRRLLHIPFAVARGGALLTQRLPGAPLTTDQVRMLQLDDIVVTNSDAVEAFQLPLVPLEEQIRRVA